MEAARRSSVGGHDLTGMPFAALTDRSPADEGETLRIPSLKRSPLGIDQSHGRMLPQCVAHRQWRQSLDPASDRVCRGQATKQRSRRRSSTSDCPPIRTLVACPSRRRRRAEASRSQEQPWPRPLTEYGPELPLLRGQCAHRHERIAAPVKRRRPAGGGSHRGKGIRHAGPGRLGTATVTKCGRTTGLGDTSGRMR